MGEEKGVLIIFGSPSDYEVAKRVTVVLEKLKIPFSLEFISAHREPEKLTKRIKNVESEMFRLIIAGAGMSAHLAGVIASRTTLPVIGIPVASGPLNGQDALLSTVQMPSGVPVATVGINSGENAAYLAARILAVSDPQLRRRLKVLFARSVKKTREMAASLETRNGS